jgi:hypothetical protein
VLPIRQGVNLRGQFSEDAWKLFVHSKISPRLAIALILVMGRPMAAKPQASPAPAAQTASSAGWVGGDERVLVDGAG